MFSKKQRLGIFLLVLFIVAFQIVLVVLNRKTTVQYNSKAYALALNEIDSLKKLKKEKKFKIYPFNPNYITDYKGYTLGMSIDEIDRLLAYRKQNKWVNSAKEFQNVTKVSDSLLSTMSPYFKFPEWVTNSKKKTYKNSFNQSKKVKFDLNTATKSQLVSIYGIGDFFATKILDYRNENDGFASYVELSLIYGIKEETIQKIKEATFIKNPKVIKQFNLNEITKDELVSIPHIDYELAFNILEYRTLNEGFKNLDELIKVYGFPTSKLEIIKLSLFVD